MMKTLQVLGRTLPLTEQHTHLDVYQSKDPYGPFIGVWHYPAGTLDPDKDRWLLYTRIGDRTTYMAQADSLEGVEKGLKDVLDQQIQYCQTILSELGLQGR